MSKDIRTKNVKKEKAVDKIKKLSAYKSETSGFSTTTSKSENKSSGKPKS